MDNTEKVLATLIVTFSVAALVIYIMYRLQIEYRNLLRVIMDTTPSFDLWIFLQNYISLNFKDDLFIIVIVLLIGVITMTYAIRSHYLNRMRKYAAPVKEKHEVIPTPIKPNPKCLYCGKEIPKDAEYCPHCGEARVRCFVCNQYIVSGDRYVKCPYCGITNHINHLPKGRKEKGYCPNCGENLKEKDIA